MELTFTGSIDYKLLWDEINAAYPGKTTWSLNPLSGGVVFRDTASVPVDPTTIVAAHIAGFPARAALKVRNAKWEEIKKERLRRTVDCAVTVHSKGFVTDPVSRSQFERLGNKADKVIAAGGSPTDVLTTSLGPVMWKTVDNSFVPMTVQLIHDILTAIENQEALVFYRAEVHRATMWASADPANYDFSAGWPAVYGE
jgi:hypothetical protein